MYFESRCSSLVHFKNKITLPMYISLAHVLNNTRTSLCHTSALYTCIGLVVPENRECLLTSVNTL